MCDPISIVAGGLAVAGGVANYAQGQSDKKAAEKAARRAMREQLRDLSVRERQEEEAATSRVRGIRRQADSAGAIARVSAGESGVSGASVEALMNDTEFQASEATMTALRNLDMVLEQIGREKKGVRAGAQSRINSVPSPSLVGTALGVASQGLDIYSGYLIRRAGS